VARTLGTQYLRISKGKDKFSGTSLAGEAGTTYVVIVLVTRNRRSFVFGRRLATL